MVRKRLDAYLVDKKIFESRARASREIKMGTVFVNGEEIFKPSFKISEEDNVEIKEKFLEYVSIAALKLKHFIEKNDIKISGKVLDVGASTGGFTEILLEKGADLVYAVDVGKSQLHERLRNNPKVKIFEECDIRDFFKTQKLFFSLITVDVSFISLRKIVPILKDNGEKFIFLFKPQFETEKKLKNRGGIVTSLDVHKKILSDFYDYLVSEELIPVKMMRSVVLGGSGNREYLFFVEKYGESFDKKLIEKEVDKDESFFINKQ